MLSDSHRAAIGPAGERRSKVGLRPCGTKGALCLCLSLLALQVVAHRAAQAQTRSFPNTKDGIFIFYDQPPFQLTPAQQQFLANNYVGCQKIMVDLVNDVRGFNGNFIVLNYRLAFGTYDTIPGYLSGNDWINDWAVVDPHDDWFITDPASPNPGGRIRQLDWGWFLMDISGEVNGNTADGWKEYWTETVVTQLRETDCDGVFADSYGLPWNLDFTPEWLVPPADTAWIQHMEIFGNHVQAALHGQPEQFYFIPNLGPWITTRDNCDYGAFIDGAMIEMFASPGPWDLYDTEDWRLEMNRLLDLERQGKVVICQPITEDEWAVYERMYNLASYLLIKGEKTYYNLVFGENFWGRLVFFPECRVNLGPYIGDIPGDIEELYDGSLGVYLREYEHGMVVVNPTWETITVGLEKDYYTIDVEALAVDPQVDVPEDGAYQDSVVYVLASDSLTVEYKGGVILLDSMAVESSDPNAHPVAASPRLVGNAPNPFDELTCISLEVPHGSEGWGARIRICDIAGREIRTIAVPRLRTGCNNVAWDGRDGRGRPMPPGVYFCSLRSDDGAVTRWVDTRRIVLLR